jgi:hypothetical protein
MNKSKKTDIKHGDIRRVNLDVTTVFEWSDKIPTDWDENGEPTEFESGFVMKVLPNQSFVYNGQKTTFLANARFEKP